MLTLFSRTLDDRSRNGWNWILWSWSLHFGSSGIRSVIRDRSGKKKWAGTIERSTLLLSSRWNSSGVF
jgi:hypothetical protein